MTTKETTHLADLYDLIAEPVRPGTVPETLYLGLEHLTSGRLVPTGGGSASGVRSTTSAFQPGDVLHGKLRPCLDKAVLAKEAGVCTTGSCGSPSHKTANGSYWRWRAKGTNVLPKNALLTNWRSLKPRL